MIDVLGNKFEGQPIREHWNTVTFEADNGKTYVVHKRTLGMTPKNKNKKGFKLEESQQLRVDPNDNIKRWQYAVRTSK